MTEKHLIFKWLYYQLGIDRLRQFLSIDQYFFKKCLLAEKVGFEKFYEISLTPRCYKNQMHVVAATEDYIRKFLPSLLGDLLKTKSLCTTTLFVGLIVGKESSNASLDILQKDFSDVNFVLMKSDFMCISSVKNCARFFLAQKLLKTCNSDVLITDIDVIITENLDQIFKSPKKINKIKLRRGRDSRFYCYAGCIFLSSDNKLEIVDDLCKRISLRFLSKNWYTDQISLWFTYKKFKKYFSAFTEREFSVKNKKSIIFAMKGSNKYSAALPEVNV